KAWGSQPSIFSEGEGMFSMRGQTHLIGAAQKILTGAGVVTATAIFGFVFSAVTFGTIPPANALPSFARQTGQPCGTCHTDYPGLTPYGRLFKLGGYTAGGGKYRSTLFPSQNDSTNALAAYAKKWGSDLPTKAPSDTSQSIPYAPPISMMAIVGFTHTQANQDPTVQDPWNTTPAWAFPYAVSNVAPTPGAGTLIAGAFAAHVGGVGAY